MTLSMSHIKWFIYCVLLTIGLTINLKKFATETYMRFALRKQPIVISFTTTPHRINNMQATIETILKQNIRVDAVYLLIPYIFKRENLPYVIPTWLLNDKRITILRTDDYGPATKLLGVLANVELDPETIIITFDDDIKYPKNAALQLAYQAMRNPNAAFGISGAHPAYMADGYLDEYYFEGLKGEPTPNGNATILQGFGGIAYRKKFFANNIFEIAHAPNYCINSDDLYLSFHLAKSNIGRKIVKNKYIHKDHIRYDNDIGHQDDALHKLSTNTLDRHYQCITYMKKLNPEVVF